MAAVEWFVTVVGVVALIFCIGFTLYFYGLIGIVALGIRRPQRVSRRTAWAILAAPWIIATAFVLWLFTARSS